MNRPTYDYRYGKKTRMQPSRRRKKNQADNFQKWRATQESLRAEEDANEVVATSTTTDELNDEANEASSHSDADEASSHSGSDNGGNELHFTPRKSHVRDPESELVVDNTTLGQKNEFRICGRRVVDIDYFFKKLQEINNHSEMFGCSISDMDIVGEVKRGFKSILKLKCRMCGTIERVYTDDPERNDIDINTATVAGAMSIGIGHAQLEEFVSALDAPAMSSHTFTKYHETVAEGWEKTALQDMKDAVAEEVRLAVERGDVDSEGRAVLTVVCDGCWSKRSYRKNYNALSGAAAIVGYYSQKVLYMAVRNKYCIVCNRAANKETTPTEHKCYKNWSGSSTSMEASIIVEGFQRSEEMYGVRYGRMIADGDSSVYSKILEARPYVDLTVEKIECRNHLLRNFCEKLRGIAKDSSLKNIFLRKEVKRKILKMRRAITSAVKHYKNNSDLTISDKIKAIRKDITNSPFHVFGDHEKCSDYFCTGPKEKEVNRIPALRRSGILYKITSVTGRLVDNAESLLKDVDNNPAEHFNSAVSKKVGNKRVNFSLKGGYSARSYASVVSHNTHTPIYRLHKTMFGSSPGTYTKQIELRRKRRAYLQSQKEYRRRKLFSEKMKSIPDKDYGPNAEQPDMPEELFKERCEEFLVSMKRTPEELRQLERDTVTQSQSGRWIEERRRLLTASMFGQVCNLRATTSCKNTIRKMLYSGEVHSKATDYGKEHEDDAIRQMEKELGITVDKCGLFVDSVIPFLGATPDGLIGDDGIVEIKCPYSAQDMTPNEGIAKGKITFWNFDKKTGKVTTVKRKHNHFFQIQGQLHITKRKYALYGVWTPLGIKIENVTKDDTFWETEMRGKLQTFYMDCVLPELVDPRQRRSMEIRNPSYICEAIKKHAEKREEKDAQQHTSLKRKKNVPERQNKTKKTA